MGSNGAAGSDRIVGKAQGLYLGWRKIGNPQHKFFRRTDFALPMRGTGPLENPNHSCLNPLSQSSALRKIGANMGTRRCAHIANTA